MMDLQRPVETGKLSWETGQGEGRMEAGQNKAVMGKSNKGRQWQNRSRKGTVWKFQWVPNPNPLPEPDLSP